VLDPVVYLEFALGTLAQFPRARLDAMHAQFMREVIEPAILPAATALLARHRDAGDLVVIITATNRYVTAPIAAALGVQHLIAAEPEEDASGNITGRLLGTPTQGAGKVTHTHAWLEKQGKTLSSFERSHFYSDSHNDIPLLSVVTHPVATNPNTLLATHANARGWPSLHLFND
jgi:HAD superfamily hydrolase (TIGR01490 family)